MKIPAVHQSFVQLDCGRQTPQRYIERTRGDATELNTRDELAGRARLSAYYVFMKLRWLEASTSDMGYDEEDSGILNDDATV